MLKRLIEIYKRRKQKHRNFKTLINLGDRELWDIGLTRGDIEEVIFGKH